MNYDEKKLDEMAIENGKIHFGYERWNYSGEFSNFRETYTSAFKAGYLAAEEKSRVELFSAIFKNIEEVGLEDTIEWLKYRGRFEIDEYRKHVEGETK